MINYLERFLPVTTVKFIPNKYLHFLHLLHSTIFYARNAGNAILKSKFMIRRYTRPLKLLYKKVFKEYAGKKTLLFQLHKNIKNNSSNLFHIKNEIFTYNCYGNDAEIVSIGEIADSGYKILLYTNNYTSVVVQYLIDDNNDCWYEGKFRIAHESNKSKRKELWTGNFLHELLRFHAFFFTYSDISFDTYVKMVKEKSKLFIDRSCHFNLNVTFCSDNPAKTIQHPQMVWQNKIQQLVIKHTNKGIIGEYREGRKIFERLQLNDVPLQYGEGLFE